MLGWGDDNEEELLTKEVEEVSFVTLDSAETPVEGEIITTDTSSLSPVTIVPRLFTEVEEFTEVELDDASLLIIEVTELLPCPTEKL